MIDESDGDFALLSWTGGGVIGFATLVIAIVLYFIAADNAKRSSQSICPHGGTAKLLDARSRVRLYRDSRIAIDDTAS